MTKSVVLQRIDKILTASRKALERVIQDCYSNLFSNYIHMFLYENENDGFSHSRTEQDSNTTSEKSTTNPYQHTGSTRYLSYLT